MATRSLIDTNILIYRYDERFPDKQSIASNVLREGIDSGSVRIPHQAIVEFVAVTTRGKPENRLLDPAEARREAEELMAQFLILYPDDAVLRTALRGAAAYGLSCSTRTSGPMRRFTGSRNYFRRIFSTGGSTARSRSEIPSWPKPQGSGLLNAPDHGAEHSGRRVRHRRAMQCKTTQRNGEQAGVSAMKRRARPCRRARHGRADPVPRARPFLRARQARNVVTSIVEDGRRPTLGNPTYPT